jgi:hypothetical protein
MTMSVHTRISNRAQRTPSAPFLSVAAGKPRQWEAIMVRGSIPDVNALTGWEYRGMNLGVGARLLGLRNFIKGFCLFPGGEVRGYNVRSRQNSPNKPWRVKLSHRERRRFGFYRVRPVDPESRDNAYLTALLLDYGQGGNGRFDITAALRDYVVRVYPSSDDLLLGKAFLAAGPLRLPIGYFLLEREGKTTC